jgi:phytoene dehydrogenase-like protein
VRGVDVNAALGKVGLPAPIRELASRDWDAIVVGGGHNGLTAAAYLARAGKSVLLLERREQLGGACTLEQPFPDPGYLVSPCAYVVGLLDDLVVEELELARHGYSFVVVDPGMWVPFEDGTSYAQFLDDERSVAHMRENGFSEEDIRGSFAYEERFDRARRLLRDGPRGDTWKAPSPTRAELEELLDDEELISIVFEESIAETIDRYVSDQRLKDAMFGQGVIGAFAGPRDPGTASVHLMHAQGDLGGQGPEWGYVTGGMGRVSFAIAQAALEAGATIATGAPVARIVPGEGVELDSGDRVRAPVVVSNADPKRVLAMLDPGAVPDAYRERLEAWEIRSPVVKLNAGLTRLPQFTAARGVDAHRAMISIQHGLDAAQEGFEACKRGEPAIGYCELYFQTPYDPSVAPEGRHTMSAFCQYAPYELAEGEWESRREEIGGMILDSIAAYAPDLHECVEHMQVLGPPDIEAGIGLTGGQIFQGEALPDQMWDRRLTWRTPIEGFYLCGAATHPAGSVIALNGRNAAMAVLEDLEGAPIEARSVSA